MKIRSYIILFYLKYFLIFTSLFISLIWISQILRILDIKYSISYQLIDVIYTTSLILPSYINPLLPLLILFNFFYLNFNLTATREGLIINHYVNKKNKSLTFNLLNIFLLIFYICNNELISPYFYKLYKEKEIEIRNNLKLGVPSENEFHIGEDLSIFFDSNEGQNYYDVESILYEDNQFIKADYSIIEHDKNGFNIIFYNGFRLKLNNDEKSKTIFEKFIYHIQNKNLDILLFDKEHFNTLQLIKNEQKDFYYQGHNRIFNYILFIFIIFFSDKIILKRKSDNFFILNLILFLLLITTYLINSYLIYILNHTGYSVYYYYFINMSFLSLILIYLFKVYENK